MILSLRLPFFKPSPPKNFLLLDLDETEVKTAVTAFDQEGKVSVLGKTSQRQPNSAMFGYEIADLDAVLETADFALQNLKLVTPLTPKDAILLTAAGTILGTGITVKLTRPRPQEPISQKELQLVFKKIEEKISGKAEEQLRSEQRLLPNETLKLLGSDVTEFRLDRIKVKTPLDLTGENLELALLYRFIRQRHLKVLEELLTELGLKLFVMTEKSLLLARNLAERKDGGMVLVVGSRAASLVPFRHGKIFGNYTFNFGFSKETWFKALKIALVEFPDLKLNPSPVFLLGSLNSEEIGQELKSAGWQFEIVPEETLYVFATL